MAIRTILRHGRRFGSSWKVTSSAICHPTTSLKPVRPLSSLTTKPWPTKMIESHGDYRDEAHLERHIGGPLYQHQHTLPKLPIPSLQDTIQRFLPTALPLAKSPQERESLQQACAVFPQQAEVLQQRLVARQQGEMADSSWLQLWWNQMGYLQVRDPVVVNVSYFFHFVDDPTIDYGQPSASSSSAATATTSAASGCDGANIQRGAALLYATAEFRKLVCSGQLSAETVGKQQTPLCATAYKYMFNACRVPQPQQDSYRIYDPSQHSHCIVSRKGHFFSIELVDVTTQDPLPLEVLEAQLRQCIDMADAIPSSRFKLGLLTSQNRDEWAAGRERLLSVGGRDMEEALERLESGAMLLNLDDDCPVSRQECGEMCWTGGLKSGHNRWFDKSIQVCVANNGKAGFLGEHSMMDGMPCVRYADYITGVTYQQAKQRSSLASKSPKSSSSKSSASASALMVGNVRDLFGGSVGQMLDASAPEIGSLVDASRRSFDELIGSHSLHVQSFHGYGSGWMKKAGFSPDAFVQAAMQVAVYRLFGEMVGTYEATQVRPFLHGRTETTRTVSSSMEAFVKMMGSRALFEGVDSDIRKKQLVLLREAAERHSQYIRLAAKAEGVDRHFFGLSLLKNHDDQNPELFDHPLFVRSKTWRASTSHLTHPRFANWGFGEVVPDGVGLGYSILPRSCTFNITALEKNEWTDKLGTLLEEALLEMQIVAEASE